MKLMHKFLGAAAGIALTAGAAAADPALIFDLGGKFDKSPRVGEMTESRGLIRLLNQVIHSRAVLGIFDNSLNMGPSMTSLAILFFILGLEKVLSVAGDNAIAASALRMF